ncbi:MAG: hypothetical protein ACRD24_03240 [Terriglobales bacterium]
MVLRRLWTFLLLASTLVLASPPIVRKVEPPNWRIGSSAQSAPMTSGRAQIEIAARTVAIYEAR